MDAPVFPLDLKLPFGMKYHELPTGDYPLAFWGRFIHEVDTEGERSRRWAHLKLFGIIDTNPAHNSSLKDDDENKNMYGKEMYLLYTIGHTLVYHDEDSACRGGVRVQVSDFPRKTADFPRKNTGDPDLEPCEVCMPRDYRLASPGDFFKLEVTWYTPIPCQSAKKLIESLYREPRCDKVTCRHKSHENRKCHVCGCASYREAPPALSTPGRQLLDEVRDSEPEIAKAMEVKRWL